MGVMSKLKPRTAIYSAVIVLTVLALALPSLMALHTYREYQSVRMGRMAVEAGLLIQSANHYYAMERGFTAALIASDAAAADGFRDILPKLGFKADTAMQQAQALASALLAESGDYPLLHQSLAELRRAYAALEEARSLASPSVDSTAAPLTPLQWIGIATRHIRRAAQLRNSVSAYITSVPVTVRSYWVLDSWISEMGEHAGRERALLAAFIAARKSVDTNTLALLEGYRGVVDSHLQQIAELLKQESLDPRIQDSLKEIETNFGVRFQSIREEIYRSAALGHFSINAASWLNLSTAAINSMVKTSGTIGEIIQDQLALEIRNYRLRLTMVIAAVFTAMLLAALGIVGTASGARRLETAREAAVNHLLEVEREAEARHKAESALRTLVEKNPVGTLVVDRERRILFANPAALEMLGADFDQLQADPPKLPLLVGVRTEHAIQRTGRSGGIAELTVTDTEWEESHAYLIMLRDMTDAKLAELALQHVSRHDPLTGLPNHTLFMDRLEQALIRARRFAQALRVVIVDFDRFRFINETLGHAIGDRLLRNGAERIRTAVRETDSVARIGSDQFAILLENLSDSDGAEIVLRKIAHSFDGSHEILGQQVRCTVSIGFSDFPSDAGDAETLVRYADIALQSAKQSGGNTSRPFSAELHARAASRPRLEQALAGAVARNELSLHYQPRIDLRTGRVTGMEALVRWQHPELGAVSPAEFIPIAEDSGLIIAIGDWVLHTACTQALAWQYAGLPAVTVSVNLSALQLAQYDIADTIAEVLRETGLPPHCLELEITESALIHNAESAADKLTRLRELGVRCSIDDFGTGYSSLSYLRQLPIHALKVDRSFIHKVSRDPGNAAITTAIISMAHDLGLHVVAEGVESEEDAAYLRQRDCDEVQGHYFARPLPAPEFAAYLAQPPAFGVIDLASSEAHRTLLILDDDRNVLNALIQLLRNEGYNILTATDPDQAFKLLARHRTGLIISDLRMPRMSGIEFLKRCRQLHPEAARIILSAADDREAVMASINEVAVYKFINKPWNDAALRNAVRDAFSNNAGGRRIASTPY